MNVGPVEDQLRTQLDGARRAAGRDLVEGAIGRAVWSDVANLRSRAELRSHDGVDARVGELVLDIQNIKDVGTDLEIQAVLNRK